MEADLVAHSGPTAEGSFVQTLTLTDIASGWTECAPLLVREQVLLTEVLGEVRKRMPFPLLGFDTDNDSVFLNETVQSYCKEADVEFTRCRPYRKNDQAWVEQKNGAPLFAELSDTGVLWGLRLRRLWAGCMDRFVCS